MMKSIINVHIGKLEVASGDVQLQTILGSCIGIGIFWKKRNLYGLAHCLLAESPSKEFIDGAKYVDQAIQSLIQRMSIVDPTQVRAVVVGGGSMTRYGADDKSVPIGDLNTMSAELQLRANRIRIVKQDTGGISGRKFIINCSDGQFDIRVLPRLTA